MTELQQNCRIIDIPSQSRVGHLQVTMDQKHDQFTLMSRQSESYGDVRSNPTSYLTMIFFVTFSRIMQQDG